MSLYKTTYALNVIELPLKVNPSNSQIVPVTETTKVSTRILISVESAAAMQSKDNKRLVVLDGRTGEGGGQLVRIAACLSAITGAPIRIHNIRGNRPEGRGKTGGGGLKRQHEMCVRWLANATQAELTGCATGSKEFTMIPTLGPGEFRDRNIRIHADTPASILLVFQALFPFLVFASNANGEPITLTIMGGTNVGFSLSYDYIDQVVLPSLELLGVPKVERRLEYRGWSHGGLQIGSIKFKFTPFAPDETLDPSSWPRSMERDSVKRIDVTIVVPRGIRDQLKASLKFELDLVFPGVETRTLVDENSGHPARLYALLVAHTTNGFRFGRDWLYDKTVKGKSMDDIATEMAQRIVDELDTEIRKRGCVDEYLQDQVVVFQALAKGRSVIFDSSDEQDADLDEVFDRTHEPFGNGSLHTRTAKWVVSQLLPQVRWLDKGRICEGVGYTCKSDLEIEKGFGELTLNDPAEPQS